MPFRSIGDLRCVAGGRLVTDERWCPAGVVPDWIARSPRQSGVEFVRSSTNRAICRFVLMPRPRIRSFWRSIRRPKIDFPRAACRNGPSPRPLPAVEARSRDKRRQTRSRSQGGAPQDRQSQARKQAHVAAKGSAREAERRPGQEKIDIRKEETASRKNQTSRREAVRGDKTACSCGAAAKERKVRNGTRV